jgi:magnesium-transporting ATPase (P-type)
MDALCVKTTHYFIGGISLVTALAWNSSIRSAIEEYFPIPNKTMAGFAYAIIITVILVIVIYMLPDTEKELPHEVRSRLKSGNNSAMEDDIYVSGTERLKAARFSPEQQKILKERRG